MAFETTKKAKDIIRKIHFKNKIKNNELTDENCFDFAKLVMVENDINIISKESYLAFKESLAEELKSCTSKECTILSSKEPAENSLFINLGEHSIFVKQPTPLEITRKNIPSLLGDCLSSETVVNSLCVSNKEFSLISSEIDNKIESSNSKIVIDFIDYETGEQFERTLYPERNFFISLKEQVKEEINTRFSSENEDIALY